MYCAAIAGWCHHPFRHTALILYAVWLAVVIVVVVVCYCLLLITVCCSYDDYYLFSGWKSWRTLCCSVAATIVVAATCAGHTLSWRWVRARGRWQRRALRMRIAHTKQRVVVWHSWGDKQRRRRRRQQLQSAWHVALVWQGIVKPLDIFPPLFGATIRWNLSRETHQHNIDVQYTCDDW